MPPRRATKAPTESPVRDPLSYFLGTRAKVACLRILALIAEPVTQRELARRTGLQHRTIQLALQDLVTLGLVTRIEGGRDFLVRLNREHRLAPAVHEMFRREAEHFLELRRALVEAAARGKRNAGLVSLLVFGSVARGEDDVSSDLDVMVIAADAAAREHALERLEAAADNLRRRFGVRLRPIGYTVARARRLWRARRAPFPDVGRDAIVLFGKPVAAALNGAD